MLMEPTETDRMSCTRAMAALLALIPGAAMAELEADVGSSGVYLGTAGGAVVLDASGSDTSDCKIAYYSWTIQHPDAAYDTIETSYDTDQYYSFDLSEVDGPTQFSVDLSLRCRMISDSGTTFVEDVSDKGIIEVLNADPIIWGISYDSPIYEGDTVDFAAIISDAEPDDVLHITWDFVDGLSLEGDEISRVFTDDDVFALSLLVVDDDGGSDSRPFEIPVNNLDPEISCDPATEVWVGEMWSLSPAATDAGDDTLEWSIDPLPDTAFFDSSTGEMDWSPGNDEVGTHSLVLTIEDGDGGSDSVAFEVQVLSEQVPEDTALIDDGKGDLGRDSGDPENRPENGPHESKENIGCGCSQGSSGIPWVLAIMMAGIAGSGRRH
jgi:hypothetical protein